MSAPEFGRGHRTSPTTADAEKYLRSCRLSPTSCEAEISSLRARLPDVRVWNARTNAGPRRVTWSKGAGWKIEKTENGAAA